MGYEQVFHARVPTTGRIAYFDTMRGLQAMTEVIELGADFDATSGRFHRATLNWDGNNPVRSFL